MRTKEGTEMKIMMTVLMRLSTHVFFLRAATMPRVRPKGTEMKIETMLRRIEYGRRLMRIDMTGWLKPMLEVEVPQSQRVKTFTSQARYRLKIGRGM